MVWYIDPYHTQATFSVKHMMVSTVRGRLGKLRGEIDIDPKDPQKARFEIGADVSAIDTGDARRDGHLRSADFFDVEKYPEIVFKSSAVFPRGENKYAVSGGRHSMRCRWQHLGRRTARRASDRADRRAHRDDSIA